MKKSDQNSQIRHLSFEEMMPFVNEQLSCGGSVELPVRGRSMLPLLQEGRDSVILRSLKKPLKKHDVILYKRESGTYVLHRIVALEEGGCACKGDNQRAVEHGITHAQIIARMVAFRRGGRLVRAHILRYKVRLALRRAKALARKVKRRLKR